MASSSMSDAEKRQFYDSARGDFSKYKIAISAGNGKAFKTPPHLFAVEMALMSVARFLETGGQEGISRLIIEMPPGHGKSVTVSQMFPTWLLGRNPAMKIMLTSYAVDLASLHSKAARDIIQSDMYRYLFPHVKLDPATQSKEDWNIDTHGGGMAARGIFSSATGRRVHLLIIDDPLKNRLEAESRLKRDRLFEEYKASFYTRQLPPFAIIVMNTRWHRDDLTGRLLKQRHEGWHRLRLPAIAEPKDPLKRQRGQALWEDMYPIDRLEDIRKTLGEYNFQSLYQQNPIASGGLLFDIDQIEVVEPYDAPKFTDLKDTLRWYDLAITKNKRSDYTASVLMGIDEQETVWCKVDYHEQKLSTDLERDIVAIAHQDGTDIPIRLEGEKAGIAMLQYLLENPDLRGFDIATVSPKGDKETRARAIATRVNHAKFKLVQTKHSEDALEELSTFPNGVHDDIVDAISGAYNALAGQLPIEDLVKLFKVV